MNSILNSLDTEESFNILNKTSEQIFQEKYNAINELDLEEEILNKLLNQLDKSFSKSKSKHRPNEKSWLDGIKEFFDK